MTEVRDLLNQELADQLVALAGSTLQGMITDSQRQAAELVKALDPLANQASEAWRKAAQKAAEHVALVIDANPRKSIDEILKMPDVQQVLRTPFRDATKTTQGAIRKAHDVGVAQGTKAANRDLKAAGLKPVREVEVDTDVRDRTLADAERNGNEIRDKLLAAIRSEDPAVVKAELLWTANAHAPRAAAGVDTAGKHAAQAAKEDAYAKGSKGSKVFKLWVTSFSAGTCATCAALHGTKRSLGQAFPMGDGPKVYGATLGHPPRHPNCRCRIVLYRDEFAKEPGPSIATMLKAAKEFLAGRSRPKLSEPETELRLVKLANGMIKVRPYLRRRNGKIEAVIGYKREGVSGIEGPPSFEPEGGSYDRSGVDTLRHPDFVYHVTDPRHRASIEQTGLRGGEYGQDEPNPAGNYFREPDTENFQQDLQYPGYDVWKVDVRDLPLRADSSDADRSWFTRELISPERLTLVRAGHVEDASGIEGPPASEPRTAPRIPRMDDLPPDARALVDEYIADNNIDLDAVADSLYASFGDPEAVRLGKVWYTEEFRKSATEMGEEFGIGRSKATAIIAITSAQKRWSQKNGSKPNLEQARKFIQAWADGEAEGDIDEVVARLKPKMGYFMNPGFGENVFKLLRGEMTVDEAITGPKRRSFYDNGYHPEDSVAITNDTWMAEYMVRHSTLDKEQVKADLSKKPRVALKKAGVNAHPAYIALSEALMRAHERALAEGRVTEGWLPHQTQATAWMWLSRLGGKLP